MPFYDSSEQLYQVLKLLFSRISAQNPEATQAVNRARLIIRFKISSPQAELLINGKRNPAEIIYGPSNTRPDIVVDITADGLHNILLGELRLRKALGSGQMKVKGPVWKSFVLEDIFHQGQTIYPEILREKGLPPRG